MSPTPGGSRRSRPSRPSSPSRSWRPWSAAVCPRSPAPSGRTTASVTPPPRDPGHAAIGSRLSYGGRRRGTLTLAGIDPWDVPLYVTSQHCGVLMQDPEVQLFMPSLGAELAFGPANLGVPREEILRRSTEALALVRLEGLGEDHPRDLSGGQKQRAALAAVLTMQPQMLVLDEPTSQLDPLGRWEVGEAIERLEQAGDLALVVTSHESEEILHLADQVVVLER